MNSDNIIVPIDTSELARGDSKKLQLKITLLNRLKRGLSENKKCWFCRNLSYCTGYVNKTKYPNLVCDVVKNDKDLFRLFEKYHKFKMKE